MLPIAFGHVDLYRATKLEKQAFMSEYKVDFVDLVEWMFVEMDWKLNYKDTDIDRRQVEWRRVSEIVRDFPLKRVFLTRKSFGDVPNIRKKMEELKVNSLSEKNIHF